MKKTKTLFNLAFYFVLLAAVGWAGPLHAQSITAMHVKFQGDVNTVVNQNLTVSLPAGSQSIFVEPLWRFYANSGLVVGIADTWKNGVKISDDCVNSAGYYEDWRCWQYGFVLGAGFHSFRVQVRLINLITGQTVDIEDRTYTINVISNNLSAYISGPTSACYGDYKTWNAVTSGGTGSKTYRWDIKYGSGGYNYAGSGSSYSTTMPPGMDIDLKLTVTAGSQSVTDYHHVYNSGNCFAPGGGKTLAEKIPKTSSLEQNYPNPFKHRTNIDFALTEATHVNLKVYDMKGNEVEVLLHEKLKAGIHSIPFDASDLPVGLYLYRIEAGDFVQTKRMNLVR